MIYLYIYLFGSFLTVAAIIWFDIIDPENLFYPINIIDMDFSEIVEYIVAFTIFAAFSYIAFWFASFVIYNILKRNRLKLKQRRLSILCLNETLEILNLHNKMYL